jgi:hypothetical protein
MDFDVVYDYPPRAAEPSIQAQTAEILSRSRPRYIVDVQPVARIEKFPHFRSLIARHYDLEAQIAGVRLYRLRQEGPTQQHSKGRVRKRCAHAPRGITG